MAKKKEKIKKEIIIDPDLDERKQDGYYFIQMYCSNCGEPSGMYQGGIDVMIREGQLKPVVNMRCPNCKCLTLK